jgi:hypothetical protein
VLGVVGTLANPSVALTVGALGGGLFGWSFIQRSSQSETNAAPEATADVAVEDVSASSEPSAELA